MPIGEVDLSELPTLAEEVKAKCNADIEPRMDEPKILIFKHYS
jgi:hypothetical protein